MSVPAQKTTPDARVPDAQAWLVVVVLLGSALRLYFLSATQWLIEGDEAAVGLQALHIMRGERPIFYPGQAYLGNIESYMVAAVFSAVGVSRYALKLVPFAFALAFIYLCFQIGKEIFDNPRVGLIAALLAAIAPAYLLMWSLKARGGFIEALVYAQLAWLWFHRWLSPKSAQLPPRRLSGLIFGLVAGYTLWLNPLAVYLLAPLAGVALLHAIRHRRAWRSALPGMTGAALGTFIALLPLLLYRLAFGRELLSRVEEQVPPTGAWRALVAQAWRYFWQDGVPPLIGLREPRAAWMGDWRIVIIPVYAAALLWMLRQAARSRAALVLALMLVLAFPIFAFGSLTGGNFAVIIPDSGLLTRYLLPLWVLLIFALALLFARLTVPLAGGALALVLAVNLWSLFSIPDTVWFAQNEFSNQRLPASQAELIRFLEQNDLHAIFTNHWIGFPLMLETHEQVVTFDYPDVRYGMNRFPEYGQIVQAASNPALVVFDPHYEPNPIDSRLKQLGVAYQKTELEHFIVYYGFNPYVHPSAYVDVLQWPYY